MNPDRDSLLRSLRNVTALVALAYVALYAATALMRMGYPFELEWMEGGVVDHVRRVLAHQPLYVPPSMRFVPYIYPPLYFYVGAAAARLLGVGILPLRLISFVASLGCLIALAGLAYRETGQRSAGIIAAGLYAATFKISGAWFDLARVDSLFLLLVLVALFLFRFGVPSRGWIAGAILFLLAFHTKQAALIVAAPVFLYAVLVNWRAGMMVAGGFVMVTAATVVALDRMHGGWYVYYVFWLPAKVQVTEFTTWPFWTADVFRALPVASVLAAGTLLMVVRRIGDRRSWFYLLAVAGLVASSWASRLHSGAFVNVLIPTYAAIAMLVGLAVHEFVVLFGSKRAPQAAIYVLCLGQFALLRYDPRSLLPTPRDLEAGRQLLALMSSVRGEVFLPWHGYLPVLAHKRTYAQGMAVYDIGKAGEPDVRDRLQGEITGAIRDRQFDLVILDRVEPWLRRDLESAYRLDHRLFDERDVFWPVTGLRTRPELVYVPRQLSLTIGTRPRDLLDAKNAIIRAQPATRTHVVTADRCPFARQPRTRPCRFIPPSAFHIARPAASNRKRPTPWPHRSTALCCD